DGIRNVIDVSSVLCAERTGMEQSEPTLHQLIDRWRPGEVVERIETITPDASLRRFYRLYLPDRTVVAMMFDSTASAEVGGQGPQQTADAAYIELTTYFRALGWPVPELLLDARDVAALLLEDVGQTLLIHTIAGSRSRTFDRDAVSGFYREALDRIRDLQRFPHDPAVCAFQRRFTDELYRREMSEFWDFVFLPRRPTAAQQELMAGLFEQLVERLTQMPVVLSHRDFHSWNLLLDGEQRVRIVDFQDALLAPRTYDAASLLNDRDTDSALGAELYRELEEYFLCGASSARIPREEYLLVLLQRDLKVAGRFVKLVQNRGLVAYEEWIPGTVRRIVRGLKELGRQGLGREYAEAAELIESMLAVHDG
ncbi:MAG: phosphotransferase, partial [Bdellovibrionales bacterium]|nr:phosphotransferase [Bdellovibrionales bacterium]